MNAGIRPPNAGSRLFQPSGFNEARAMNAGIRFADTGDESSATMASMRPAR